MRKRPLGITALSFASVMVGLYSLIAAIALLLGSMVGGVFGGDLAVVVAIGALYVGLMAAAFFVGYGFWTQRHWSWAGGLVVFSVLIVASVLLTLLATSMASSVVVGIGAVVAIWHLLRPGTKAQLLGADVPEMTPEAGAAPLETPQGVR